MLTLTCEQATSLAVTIGLVAGMTMGVVFMYFLYKPVIKHYKTLIRAGEIYCESLKQRYGRNV